MSKRPARRPSKPPVKPTAGPKPAPVLADAGQVAAPTAGADAFRFTNETAGKIIGIGARQLTSLRSKGCPVPEGGVRTVDDVARIAQWRMEQAVAEARRDADAMIQAIGGMSPEIVEAKRAMVSLKLDQLKLGEKKGLVLPKGVYVHVLSMMLAEVASLLRAQGSQLGPLVAIESDARACQEIIDEANDTMLLKLTVGNALDLTRLEQKEDERFAEEAGDGVPAA